MVQLLKIDVLDIKQQILHLIDFLFATEFDEQIAEMELFESEEFLDG